MGVPGADDVMLEYQSTSYHDIAYLHRQLAKRPAPEFDFWLQARGITDGLGRLQVADGPHPLREITR